MLDARRVWFFPHRSASPQASSPPIQKKQQQACFFNTKMMCLCLTLLLERDPHKSEKEGWTETAISRRRWVGGRLPAQWGEQGNAEWMGSIFKQSTLLPWAIYMVGLTFTFTIMHTCMVTGAGRMVELTKLEKIIGAKKKDPTTLRLPCWPQSAHFHHEEKRRCLTPYRQKTKRCFEDHCKGKIFHAQFSALLHLRRSAWKSWGLYRVCLRRWTKP